MLISGWRRKVWHLNMIYDSTGSVEARWKKIWVKIFGVKCFGWKSFGWKFCGVKFFLDGNFRVKLSDQGEVSIIRLGMLKSSGFQKYSTLLVIQLLLPRFVFVIVFVFVFVFVFLIHFWIAVTIGFQIMYGFGGSGARRSEIWSGVTIAGQWTNKQRTRKDRAT